MFYSPKYFRDGLPVWKRKKGTLIGRFIYRPISYLFSSLFSSIGIEPNSISYFSILVACIGASLFLFDNYILAIIGAAVINFWLILDCVDGNMARCIHKQAYGEFADAISSYTLVPLMSICVAFYAYKTNSVFVDKLGVWIIMLGAVGGITDSLMRLYYQKFINNTNDLIKLNVIEETPNERKDHSKVGSIKNRIESIYSTYILIFLIFAVIFNITSIFVIIVFSFNSLSFLFIMLKLLTKAKKYQKVYFNDENDKD